MMRLGRRAHIRAVRHFKHFLEADLFERGFHRPQRNPLSELPDDRRRNLGDYVIAAADRADELVNL